MTGAAPNAVVVGVSPTTGSPNALRWAAEEARLRGVPLRAVMAWRPPRPPSVAGTRPPAGVTHAARDHEADARQTLRDFLARALGRGALDTEAETGADGSGVQCEVVRGSAVTALLASAWHAQLLVIGEPRAGRVSSVRTSLVAPQVMLRAGCPVVVMPAGDP